MRNVIAPPYLCGVTEFNKIVFVHLYLVMHFCGKYLIDFDALPSYSLVGHGCNVNIWLIHLVELIEQRFVRNVYSFVIDVFT